MLLPHYNLVYTIFIINSYLNIIVIVIIVLNQSLKMKRYWIGNYAKNKRKKEVEYLNNR
ncbi:hypothetical protein GCM10025860_20800 [Methanobacterium ferruginis]|nr:hypothetical protein GCM10025860_20800 [Methanobacterium ferruginis]